MVRKGLSTEHELDKLFLTLAEMIYETEMSHGGSYWPFNPVRFHIAIASRFFRELYRLIMALEECSFSAKDIAALFVNPNRIADYNFMWPFVKGLSLEEKQYLASRIVEMLRILRNGDPFCESERSLVWSHEQLEREVSQSLFLKMGENAEMLRGLSRLETLLTSYAELLYYMFPGFSRMYHGPYTYDGQTVFVKEFIDLRPKEVWGFSAHFPFEHYRAIGLYGPCIEFKVHFIGLFESNIPPIQALEACSVRIDGKAVTNAEELGELVTKVETVTGEGIGKISILSEAILFQKGVQMFFRTLKRLYAAAGEEYRVPQKVDQPRPTEKDERATKPLDDLTKDEAIDRILAAIDFRRVEGDD